jgi:hypothetical protein
VEDSNSCVRTLIFGSFLLLLSFFPLPLFRFFDLAFYCLFYFFIWFFYRPMFSPSFSLSFCTCLFFWAHVVSALAYPNLLGNKRPVVVVFCHILFRIVIACSSEK